MNYGTATLVGDTWHIKCQPHAMLKLKRVFPSVGRGPRDVVLLTATDENCRELEWFAQRYPLEFSEPEVLTALARAYDQRRETVLRIMDGQFSLLDVRMQHPPRHYQQQAAALVQASGGLLLADDVGLGKTIAAIATFADPALLPALVVVQTHLTRQWKAEIERFLPFAYVHIVKKGTPYPTAHEGRNPDVLIVNYHKLRGWADHCTGFPTVVFDEVQELRRARDAYGPTQRWSAAQQVAGAARIRLGLSATPIYNYGDEFWNVLEILRPGALGSREEFLTEWCRAAGSNSHAIKDPKAFGSFVRDAGLMLRRTRADVGRELPALSRIVHVVESNKLELAADTNELARILLADDAKNFDKMRAGGEFDMRLRQATGLAKAPYVAEFVKMLLAGGPVVLFGWHRLVWDRWAELLSAYEPAWYTGAESPARKAAELERFKSGATDLLFMSLRSGSGVDGLQHRCSQVVIGELDWSPGVLVQCVGRAHRDGQKQPVFAYFPVSNEGADPVMVDVLDLKQQQVAGVNDPDAPLVAANAVDPEHIKKLARAWLESRPFAGIGLRREAAE